MRSVLQAALCVSFAINCNQGSDYILFKMGLAMQILVNRHFCAVACVSRWMNWVMTA